MNNVLYHYDNLHKSEHSVMENNNQRCVALDISWLAVSLILVRSWLNRFLDEDEQDISASQARRLDLNCV